MIVSVFDLIEEMIQKNELEIAESFVTDAINTSSISGKQLTEFLWKVGQDYSNGKLSFIQEQIRRVG